LADEIKMQFGAKVNEIECRPSENSGTFDVFLDEELIYSKLKQTGRLPLPGEVEQILFERLMK
jgi:predicted Rdx family selenoprotein